MFFEGIRSERKLMETASLNLAHRWYLGYAFDKSKSARPGICSCSHYAWAYCQPLRDAD
jgi:hypothetical protein